jgi:hypothetical protein
LLSCNVEWLLLRELSSLFSLPVKMSGIAITTLPHIIQICTPLHMYIQIPVWHSWTLGRSIILYLFQKSLIYILILLNYHHKTMTTRTGHSIVPQIQKYSQVLQKCRLVCIHADIQWRTSTKTVTATSLGVLSALSTGWWGEFGDRRGRTKVLLAAAAATGQLFTYVKDITWSKYF